MAHSTFLIGLLAVTGIGLAGPAAHAAQTTNHDDVQPCVAHHPPVARLHLSDLEATLIFSPQGGGEQLIVQAIDGAQHSILMQAYSFTDANIFAALGRAQRRGVSVQVILDKSDLKHYRQWPSVADRIAAMNIPVWIDATVETAHNKVLVLDDDAVITGSYNFSYAADQRNAENLLYLQHAPQLVHAYSEDWQWRRNCSRRFVP